MSLGGLEYHEADPEGVGGCECDGMERDVCEGVYV